VVIALLLPPSFSLEKVLRANLAGGFSALKAVDTLQHNSRRNTEEEESSTSFPNYSAPQQAKGFTEGELFSFDPNALPVEGWQRLGLNDKTTRILINYRNKGGRFYKPEDLKKVWTMPVGLYEREKDHITIPSGERPASNPTFTKSAYNREERKIQPVDINLDDTAAFIALPGIRPVLAGRILNFRDKLGGFHPLNKLEKPMDCPTPPSKN
jgi:competence protein ComEA